MKLHIQSIHFDADKKLLEFIQEKCTKLDKFFDRITDGNVVLKIDKDTKGVGNKWVEIRINVPNDQLIVKEQSESFEESINQGVDNLKRQITKYKEKQSVN